MYNGTIQFLPQILTFLEILLAGSSRYLTTSFFESGPMPTPTKLQNPTIVGSGDQDSAKYST